MTTLQLSLLQPAPSSFLLPAVPADEPTESKSFKLRDYQQQVIRELYQLYRQGIRRPFIYAPTGSGKTAIASKILADAVNRGRRCLFLVHRDPLVKQTQKALTVYGIQAGVIKAGHKENRALSVQIASIQSLAQRQFPDDIDVIVIDECHTTCWYKTFDRVKETYPTAFYVGLTASPWRSKSFTEYMGQHFNGIVKAPSVAELISMGFLAPPRYFGFGGLLDLAEIDNGNDGSDFNEKQVQRACMKAGFNERIIKEYQAFADGRTAIIFCSGVEQSRLITSLFNKVNITCEHLEADTDSDERAAICKRLQLGETRVLSSVGTLTEGFDEPRVSCVVLARPTRSRALLFQMAGRGLRMFPGKQDCLMLDFSENFSRLGFLTDSQPIQLEPLKPKDVRQMLKECDKCHQMVSIFALICPFCGYEFSSGAEEEDDDTGAFDAEMGELFADEQKPKVTYLRTQIRRLYKNRLPIDKVWQLFEKKWGQPAPNEWHKGAVFGKRGSKRGGDTEANRQRYLNYLHQINPNPNDLFWVKFHIELEFGKQKKASNQTRRQHQKQ